MVHCALKSSIFNPRFVGRVERPSPSALQVSSSTVMDSLIYHPFAFYGLRYDCTVSRATSSRLENANACFHRPTKSIFT